MARGPHVSIRPNASSRRGASYESLRLVKELEWLRTMAHVAPVAIFRTDSRGICTYVNEHWCELTGYTANAATGVRWQLAVHPEDATRIQAEWERTLNERLPFRFEHRYLQPNGRIVWVISQVAREVDGRGRPTGYTGMSTDVTALRQMRDELAHSHAALEVRMRDRSAELQRMARIVESIDDAVISADLKGRVLSWNCGAEAIFGYTAAEMIGQTIFSLATESRQDEAHGLETQLRSGEEIHRFETQARTKAGEVIEVVISGFPLRDASGAIVGTWAILRDVTQQKRSERQLRQLSRRLLSVQDEERRRIARELHDSTAQAMAALAINLAALAREDAPLSKERRAQILRDSLTLADQATSELRTTAYLLHPPLLEERGLPAALGWFVNGFAERSGIRVQLEIAPEFERLSAEVETALFRVAQESLLNVHRHSGSNSVKVRLFRNGVGLVLEVRDRGSGPPANGDAVLGVGIAGMRERLLQLGGTLSIEANHPGTAVIARLPETR